MAYLCEHYALSTTGRMRFLLDRRTVLGSGDALQWLLSRTLAMADQLSPEARYQVLAVASSTNEQAKVLTAVEAGYVYALEFVIADQAVGSDTAQYQQTFLSVEITHRFSIQPAWDLPAVFGAIT